MTDRVIRIVVDASGVVKGVSQSKKAFDDLDRKTKKTTKGLTSGFKAAAGAVAAFAGALVVREIFQAVDAFQSLQNRLRIVTDSTEELASVQKELFDIAQNTRTSFEAVVKLYGATAIAAEELGASTEELLRLTEISGKALAIQGSSANESRGALRQLSQAFSSGIVRAAAFNSILEGAFPLAQAAPRRFGGGVGEATVSPSAYSRIADSFPLRKIAFALGVYGMGVTLGANMANLLGAWAVGLMEPGVLYDLGILGERERWQIVFFLICLPTIPLTFIMFFVKEPYRRNVRRVKAADGEWKMAKPPKGELQAYLRKNWKTVLCHNVGFAWLAFSGYGLGAWLPAFYMRIHGLTASQAGYTLGIVGLTLGTAGTVFGGWVADKMYARGYRDAKMRIGVFVALAWIPFGLVYPFMPNIYLVVAAGLAPAFIGAMTIGVQAAAIQEIMPNRLRGRASAIFLFFNSLIGLGLGPGCVGFATSYLFRDEMKVHYSIALVGFTAHALAALILYLGLKPYRKTLDELKDWSSTGGA